MHPGQIAGITAALTATMITLVVWMTMSGGEDAAGWAVSSWDITILAQSEGDEVLNQVWNVDINNNKMQVVSNDGDSIFVEEIDATGTHSYSLAAPKQASDFATDEDGNAQDWGATPEELETLIEIATTVPRGCEFSASGFNEEAASASPDSGAFMGFSVTVTDGIPSALVLEDGTTYATINSMSQIESVDFRGCDVDESRRLDGFWPEGTRDLSCMQWASQGVSNSNWCGAGSVNSELGCGINQQDAACRKHDHCSYYSASGSMPGLSCRCDYNIWRENVGSGNIAVDMIYGKWSPIGGAEGCYDTVSYSSCGWRSCGWRGCSWHCTYGTRNAWQHWYSRYDHGKHAMVGSGYKNVNDDLCPDSGPGSSCNALSGTSKWPNIDRRTWENCPTSTWYPIGDSRIVIGGH